MQTFLPYPSFKESAKCLDDRRLGKQRVECLQILSVLKRGEFTCGVCGDSWENCCKMPMWCSQKQIKTPWYNHPAVKMWLGHEKSLAIYGLYICNEWIKRGNKDSCFDKIQKFIPDYVFKEDNYIDYSGLSAKEYPCPSWLGKSEFHASHKSNLLRKNPEWYGKFGWVEKNDLPYFWPTKHLTKLSDNSSMIE